MFNPTSPSLGVGLMEWEDMKTMKYGSLPTK